MNPLNQWLKLEEMDEEHPRFEQFMHEMNISNRSEVERYASLCAYKIFINGACVRINKQLGGGPRQALTILRFACINIDVLRFDDWFYTELNTMFLYELKQNVIRGAICCHCFHDLTYNHEQRFSHCKECEYVLPS